MRGHRLRIELYVVARTVPEIASIGQKIVNLKRLLLVEPELFERKLQPARLPVNRVEVYDHDDDVVSIIRPFAPADDLVVVRRMKLQAAVALKRFVLAANPVNPPDQISETRR